MFANNAISRIRDYLYTIERLLNSENYNEARELITQNLNTLSRLRSILPANSYSTVHGTLNSLLNICNVKIQEQDQISNTAYSATRNQSNERGRPNVIVTKDQLEFFLKEGYTARKIAQNLKCSISTVYKRMYEENLKFRSRYSIINDADLFNKIKELQKIYPNSGSTMMCAFLKIDGLTIQRARVRTILAQVDPIGTAIRWGNAVNRRQYHVPTPNSLWHMDAHLKLVRWGFVTHGCIDGYSRLITYLGCDTSIKANIVLKLFTGAIKKFGVPSRVRSDHGYENYFVALLMNALRGLNRGSHITGKSTHNQRIERLWRDVFQQVIKTLYDEFYSLEDINKLDPDNENHLYFLQKIYLNVINERLKAFQEAWNVHKIRTEKNKCPRELWTDGILQNIHSEHTAIQEVLENDISIERIRNAFTAAGVDENEHIINSEDTSRLTATANLSMEQEVAFQEILNSNMESRVKYLSAIDLL